MAEAKQCDRCGNLYLPYDGKKYEWKGNSYNGVDLVNSCSINYRRFDLCPECMHKMISFLKMEKSNGLDS